MKRRDEMTPVASDRIFFQRPDPTELRADGYTLVDMHVHTRHSDAAPGIPAILNYICQKGIGVAITDHNEISGVMEAEASHPESLIIPGIELDSAEGPHILIYFYESGQLADFFRLHISDHRSGKQYMERYLSVDEILTAADGYSCIKIAAHPYGYFGLNRGVLKCMEQKVIPDITGRIDGIEVICGGMSVRLNKRAARYADGHTIPITGGSDAHILTDIGNVVTAVKADTVEEFLNGILRRESRVIGTPSGFVSRGTTAGVIAYSFLPYSCTFAQSRYRRYSTHLKGAINRFRYK
ncbi:MAG: PHP-associated domain-containing protein [Methanobacteriota archaeon]